MHEVNFISGHPVCLNYSSSLHAYIKFGGLLAPSRDILRSRLAGEDLDPRVVGLLGLASAASFDSGRDGGGCTKLLRSSSWKILKGGEFSHFQASAYILEFTMARLICFLMLQSSSQLRDEISMNKNKRSDRKFLQGQIHELIGKGGCG